MHNYNYQLHNGEQIPYIRRPLPDGIGGKGWFGKALKSVRNGYLKGHIVFQVQYLIIFSCSLALLRNFFLLSLKGLAVFVNTIFTFAIAQRVGVNLAEAITRFDTLLLLF